ncbi:hypothetical protein [Leptothermofonsia sp. ETS-13]|uniref:hypothetical protein n=1 Tax=Leptothermofonsia sp. ETS-13 TaxID=3035696 RepID=UPI003BA06F52
MLLIGVGTAGLLTVFLATYSHWFSVLTALQLNPSNPSNAQQFEVLPQSLIHEPPTTPPPESLAARSLTGYRDTVWAVATSPDGQTLISGSYSSTQVH